MIDKPPLDDDLLVHYGVKGMKWGIRNDDHSGVHRFQSSDTQIDTNLHPSTQAAGKQVAALIGQRYNFPITAIRGFGPGHPEYERGTVGYVQSTPGVRGGVVHARTDDVRKALKTAESIGWSAKGTGDVRGLITHETAHAMFHADEAVKVGLFRSRTVGGNIEARDKALKAATDQAERDGIKGPEFTSKISGYAAAANTRQEAEAEMFSQYHWSPNPPTFVKVWGETLHKELGVDATPFREEVKRG